MIASFYQGDILEAVQKAVPLLKGAYAIALIHRDFPDQIIAVAHECSSGHWHWRRMKLLFLPIPMPLLTHTREVVYLANSEIAVVKADNIGNLRSHAQEQINKQSEHLADGMLKIFQKEISNIIHSKKSMNSLKPSAMPFYRAFLKNMGQPYLKN